MKHMWFGLIILIAIVILVVACEPTPVVSSVAVSNPTGGAQVQVNIFTGPSNTLLVRWIDRDLGYVCYQTASNAGGMWCGKLEQ